MFDCFLAITGEQCRGSCQKNETSWPLVSALLALDLAGSPSRCCPEPHLTVFFCGFLVKKFYSIGNIKLSNGKYTNHLWFYFMIFIYVASGPLPVTVEKSIFYILTLPKWAPENTPKIHYQFEPWKHNFDTAIFMGPSLDCCECFVAMKRPKPFLRQRRSPNPNKHQTNTHTATAPSQSHNTTATETTNTHTHKHTHTQKSSSPQHRPDPSQPQKTKTKAAHTHNSHTHIHRRSSPHPKHRPNPPHFHTSHISTTETKISTQRSLGPWQSNSSSRTNHTFECANKISFQIYRTRSSSQLCSATFQLHCLPGYRLPVLDWNCAGRRDVLHVSMQHAAC